MLYLNQAGTSWPKPAPVREAVAAALAASVDTWAASFERDHRAVCDAFGVRDPQRMLLTPGATSALAVAVADLPWRSGDRVLISAWEHHALHRPVRQLAERGVEITVVPSGDEGPVALDALRDELRRGSVRLVAMTAASNVTGDRLPIDEIITLAHEHDARVLIDAAQIAGWVRVDVDALDVDMLAFTGHKGPQAPWGIGALYVADDVEMNSPSAACELPTAGSAPCAPMPGYCDVGSVDRAALAGLVAGLRWSKQSENRDRLARARQLTAFVENALAGYAGVRLHARTPVETRMPTVAFTVDGRSSSAVAADLAEHDVLVGSGLQCAPLAHETLGTDPEGVVRVSFGPANGPEHAARLVAALDPVMRTSPR